MKEKDRLCFLWSAQAHYAAAGNYLLEKSSLLKKGSLKSFGCLHPNARTSKSSKTHICDVARALPINVPLDTLVDEWGILQTEINIKMKERVDEYWAQFWERKTLSGDLKYLMLRQVVNAALTLSHGNAFVERVFSSSGQTLTEGRASMGQRMLNATNAVKSGLKLFNNKPSLVPITKELLTLARGAYSSYEMHLESEKNRKKDETRRKKEGEERCQAEELVRQKMENERKCLSENEVKLQGLRIEEREKRETADVMTSEATGRLKKATTSKDYKEVALAQAMLEGAESIRKEANKKRAELGKLQASVEKRKSEMISGFFNKKSKR